MRSTTLVHIDRARPEEYPAVFALMFRQLRKAERRTRSANAQKLLASGDLDADGIIVLRSEGQIVGAVVAVPLPGAGGLVWPPQVVDGVGRISNPPPQATLEDELVQEARRWLRQRGAKLAQTLVAPEDIALAGPLE